MKTGILLLNLGSPDSPSKKDVFLYLREFLSDPRVVDIPKIARLLLLYGIILPFRTPRSSEAYAKIWQKSGSPLVSISKDFTHTLQKDLGDSFVVELGMRYRKPSVEKAIDALLHANVRELVVVPLYPQYASSSTGTALEQTYAILAKKWNVPRVTSTPAFFEDPLFLQAWVARIEEYLSSIQPVDYILFSFHGLPERHIAKSEGRDSPLCSEEKECPAISTENMYCYRAQCYATYRGIVAQLKFPKAQTGVSFQSRLGRTPWIKPYTDFQFPLLRNQGVKRIAVVCPSFVADCLETLEEIAIRSKETWKGLGGEDLYLIPSLNQHPLWLKCVKTLIIEKIIK